MVTAAPFRASSAPNNTADVDFPAPPLGLAKTIVGIGQSKLLEESFQIPNPYGRPKRSVVWGRYANQALRGLRSSWLGSVRS